MKINKLFTLILVFVLAFSVVGSAFAADDPPEDPPTTEDGYTHPIVALFQAYWDLMNPVCDPTVDPTCEPTTPPTCDPTTDPTCDPTAPAECYPYGTEPTTEQALAGTPECPPEFGQLVESLHEDGMGFGVMANLLAIANNCEAEEGGDPCPTFEDLVAAFQGGMGVGQLYHEYGNPGQHGVGYLKKAVKCAEADSSGKVPGYCKNADKHGNGNDKGGGPPEGKGGGNPHDD